MTDSGVELASYIKFMVDANVDKAIADFLVERRYPVARVDQTFPPATPDDDIDALAQKEGWIIVSHDKRFLNRIQQPRFNLPISISSGYGRIMIQTEASFQVERFKQAIGTIEVIALHALETQKRLLVILGPNWIRYDDMPLIQTPPQRHQPRSRKPQE